MLVIHGGARGWFRSVLLLVFHATFTEFSFSFHYLSQWMENRFSFNFTNFLSNWFSTLTRIFLITIIRYSSSRNWLSNNWFPIGCSWNSGLEMGNLGIAIDVINVIHFWLAENICFSISTRFDWPVPYRCTLHGAPNVDVRGIISAANFNFFVFAIILRQW